MSLETKSKELKEIMSNFESQWLLGNLSALIHAGKDKANDQLGKLSSPQRQLNYLAGLNITSDQIRGINTNYNMKIWEQIVILLNEIELEYQRLFFPNAPEEVTEDWKRVRQVAMPSFLSYFNQGALNYEEQVINWITDLFAPIDVLIEASIHLRASDFIQFYENLDKISQANFQAHTNKNSRNLLRANWKDYSKIKIGVVDEAPDFIKEFGKEREHLHLYLADEGIKDRFYPIELVSENLPVEKVQKIINLFTTSRSQTDFLYYTETKPGNPLYDKPIIDIGGGMYQVFEVKQVIHAVENLLEGICTSSVENTTKYVSKKGDLLEDRIVELFSKYFEKDYKVYRSYYIDGCEQDVLILWKNYAFIIEAKGYSLNEPFRNPDKAFVRIKRDFNACIGYGYEQTHRVEKKFIDEVPLILTDKNGNIIEEIDTTKYTQDFSIIVNLESFGQIQCDLSTLIQLENEDDVYPWAVKLDDLEIFLLTLMAKKKRPDAFVEFLLMRESLHGKLFCSDELEVCGGFLEKKFHQKQINRVDRVVTVPDLGSIFDKQYHKTMGFKNEKYLVEKQSGKFVFW